MVFILLFYLILIVLKGQSLEIIDPYVFLLKTLHLGHLWTGLNNLNGFANFCVFVKIFACKEFKPLVTSIFFMKIIVMGYVNTPK